jgi:class 3 adenylate cyclase/tetratricopeptide (TPR) repeat protein
MSPTSELCVQCRAALPAGARFCPACGAAVGVRDAPPSVPSGERRQVAILFADLAGYTRMSSGLDAEEVHRILSRYFELADGAIERAGGTIDKHVGDAVMGVFGAPVAHGNDVERALRAALDIHAGMATIGSDLGRALAAHIGVASGEVVAASTGSDAHRAYTVTGDAVNLASRITDLAKAGETAISDDVQHAVATLAEVEPLGDIAIRGLAAPQRVWKLRDLRAPATARVPLVGRDAERRRFAALIADVAASRQGAVVVVAGEPGLGKTRLAEAFIASALAEGAYAHAATVLDFGSGQGEDAIYALACALLDVPPHVNAAVRRDALSRAIAQGRADAAHEAYLADLVAVAQRSDSVYDAMDNDARLSGKRKALGVVVERAAAHAPCVLLVEDVHWATRWVLDCLTEIAGRIERLPVVLVMTTRREGAAYEAHWPDARTTRFELAPLAPADALALARIHFATSPDLAQRCVERAQGNPLFLVQLIKSGTDDDAIPASIQSVVLARLDRLPPADKRALQAAAVIGQRFPLDLLRSLIGVPGYEATTAIERDLVHPAEDEPGVLTFAHALIRDGAYASLLHSARRELHLAAAAWFADRDVVLRARHLDRADDPRAAAAYLDAGRAEAAAFRNDEALGLAQRGSDLAAPAGVRFALASLEGALLRDLGRAAASIAAFERAREHAPDDVSRCRAWIGIAAGHRLTSDIAPGLAALDAAQSLVPEDAPRDASRIHYLRGSLYFVAGDVARCRAEHETALAAALAAADAESEAHAQSGLADALYAQGRLLSARDAFARCVEAAERAGLWRFALPNECMLAFVDGYSGKVKTAVDRLDRIRRRAHELQHRAAAAMADESLGWIFSVCGRYAEARAPIERGLAMAREMGLRRFEASCMSNLVQVLLYEGDRAGARRLAHETWALCERIAPRFAGPNALAMVALTADSDAERDDALARGERLLAEGCIAHAHLDFYAWAIDVMLDAGQWERALRYADALESYARAEPLPWSECLVARGRALAAAGKGNADRGALEACRRDALRLGFDAAVLRLDAALAKLA